MQLQKSGRGTPLSRLFVFLVLLMSSDVTEAALLCVVAGLALWLVGLAAGAWRRAWRTCAILPYWLGRDLICDDRALLDVLSVTTDCHCSFFSTWFPRGYDVGRGLKPLFSRLVLGVDRRPLLSAARRGSASTALSCSAWLGGHCSELGFCGVATQSSNDKRQHVRY